jgi:tetratricopeptide (TPR) repeat protein
MEETFEFAVRLSKKEPLLWNVYAYCLDKIKKREKAIEVLGRARKELPNNKFLIENLVALQNDKKMRMKVYNEQWYQFHLEKPPVQRSQQTPRFSRR